MDTSTSTSTQAPAPPPALAIRALEFRYSGGSGVVDAGGTAPTWALRIDHLELARAEQLLLTAPSGRGKSTLLHLIAGLMDPDAGEVRVAGRAIHALAGHERDLFRGRTIGMIFQTLNLLQGFSAIENVAAAMLFAGYSEATTPGLQRARAIQLLGELGIERMNAPPEQMSLGQQQRVAIARALACRPALVLADEPTASLDPENAATAMGLIQSACSAAGAALLCVSHDPAVAERFARRSRLDELAAAKP